MASTANPVTLAQLRCEYRVAPLGIDVATPRLSWILQSDRRGERQTGYQILVASTPDLLARNHGDLWDSDKVDSDQQNQIEYSGVRLNSRMRCHWKVRVWDTFGLMSAWSVPALWTMGLLEPAEWQAQWIGMEERLLPKPPPSDAFDPKADDIPRLLSTPRYLRREFAVGRQIRRATVYATALGL